MPEPARGDHHPCLPRKCAQKASSGRSRISRPNVILKASNRLKLCFGLSEWNSIKVRFQQISDPFAGLWGRFWSGVKNMWDINENIEAWNWAFDQPSLSCWNLFDSVWTTFQWLWAFEQMTARLFVFVCNPSPTTNGRRPGPFPTKTPKMIFRFPDKVIECLTIKSTDTQSYEIIKSFCSRFPKYFLYRIHIGWLGIKSRNNWRLGFFVPFSIRHYFYSPPSGRNVWGLRGNG